MAFFPVLEIEDKVQVNDKTRLSGTKSFTSTGADPLVNVSITPGGAGTPIVLSPLGSPTPATTESDKWYTDWQWTSWAFDVDASNNKIDIEEAGSVYVATVTPSAYTSVSSLVAAIQSALNAAGAVGTFTATVDEAQKIKIESTVPFEILNYTGDNRFNGLLQHLGFSPADSGISNYHIGSPVEYGLRKITLSVDDDTLPAETISLYQKVYTEYGDRLFSSDFELKNHEEDILKWVSPGRSSFKDVHRRVQEMIFEYLAGHGYIKATDEKFTKWDIKDSKELRDWATAWALQLIMEGSSNAVDDVFDRKARKYSSQAIQARNRFLAIDINGDGVVESDEQLRLHSINLFRR